MKYALQEYLLNCFKKAGISSEIQVPSKSDDGDTLKLFDAQLKYLEKRRESSLVDFTVDVDEDVLTSEIHAMTDAKIIARVTQS